ncbi:MAG: hypothetical protein CO113_17465 [Elusimicrobia bacterium CG_4_9_14_3_um_filter_62_55]|nr:MAG: hypothetical protein COR54_11395 [Elusimicrobia bacterium CG22_combo_CG10-13_8_21_14_all_63_91]PJA17405.1 MAG: hypothetical protein COX66_04950 [Elusimicrobia bacterium CG_4_10_14_0_2_um_filter_63_34]PJB23590.1 MAG: hypothetical protein CO113_17465 [Elusimicrobia bacterium CG_4_9_14_3_um_filter_62_55]
MRPPDLERFSVADERVAPWVAAFAALALYLALPSFRFNHDGVACAIAVELADVKHLLHGNHLLYGVLGLTFHSFLNAIGVPLNALWSLQLMDSLLGAAGAGLFCRLLLRLKTPVWIAWLAAMGLTISHGWWLFSIDAQVYVLGAALLLPAWTEALEEKPRPYVLAFWNSLAVLGHVLNVFFFPAALYALWRSRESNALRRDMMRYCLASAVFVLGAYALAAEHGVRPAGAEELKLWLLGSAALGPGRSFLWYAPSSLGSGLADWARAGMRVVSPVMPVGAALWALAVLSKLSKNSAPRFAITTAWIAILSYLPMTLSYEPYSFDYRVTDLVGLWLLAALWLRGRRAASSPPNPWAVVFLFALAATNMAGAMRTHQRPEANRQYQKALWYKGTLPQNAWVASVGLEEVYVPYFAHLRPLSLRYFDGRPTALRERIEALARRGEPVFAASDSLSPKWIAHLDGLGLQYVDRFEEFEIYLIRSYWNGKPKGRR